MIVNIEILVDALRALPKKVTGLVCLLIPREEMPSDTAETSSEQKL